jgi:uroporphyrinogen-III synthase
LKELILRNFDKKDGKMIYVSGETISIDLEQKLIKEGYDVKRIINYKTIHNESFDENFVKELKLDMPEIVYVYSQSSASSLLKFIKFYQSESLWMNTNLMCIGEKTSAILNEIKWKKIFLFNPGEEEFLLYKI